MSETPDLAAIRQACVDRHDIVPRSLVDSFIEALGFDPSTTAALWIDQHQLTVVRRVDGKHTRVYVDPNN